MDQPIQLGLTDEKLQLEIEGLKQKNAWENSVGKWIPVITAIIAVFGFLGGIVGYVLQQRQLETQKVAAAEKLESDRAEAARTLETQRVEADRKLEEESRLAAQARQDKAEQSAQERESRELLAQRSLDENRILEEKKLAAQKKIADAQAATVQETNLSNLRADINRSNEARAFERLQRYREKQMELYFEASRAASTIATSADVKEKWAAEEKFWNLYWGPLSVVEDSHVLQDQNDWGVERAMIVFGLCSTLSSGQSGGDSFPEGTFTRCSAGELRQTSLCLAHTIRDVIHGTWTVSEKRMSAREKESCRSYGQILRDRK